MSNTCPRCHSEDIEIVEYSGAKLITCNECGYSEEDVLEGYPEDKTSQKAKGTYSKYKTGGGKRAVKKSSK